MAVLGGEAPVGGGRGRRSRLVRREVDAQRPAVDAVQGMDERVLRASIQGEHATVGPSDLGQRVAGHRLVDVALVDDRPRRAASRLGELDRPDLVAPTGIGVEVLDDVEDRAVRRQRVVVEPARELDDPRPAS